MILSIPADLINNPDIMAAVGAAVAFARELDDGPTDEVIATLAEALDEAFKAAEIIPPPAGIIVEAVDRYAFEALIRIGLAISREVKRPKRERRGMPLRRLFRRKIEAGEA